MAKVQPHTNLAFNMTNSKDWKDEISIPNINAQIFDFCDSDLFNDIQNSEVTSSPNCYCYDDQNSSYASAIVDEDTKNKFSTENLDIHSLQQRDQNDQNGTNNTSTASSSTTTAATNIVPSRHHNHHNGGLSIIFDPEVEIDNDISASIDFSSSPPFSATSPYNLNPTNTTQQDQYHHLSLSDVNGLNQYPTSIDPVALPLMAVGPPPLGPVFDEDCLSSIPPFLRLNPSAAAAATSFLDSSMNSFLHGNLNPGLSAENSGIFGGNLLLPSDLQSKELDFQADNTGIFCPDQLPRYNSGDMQAFSNENAQLGSAATSSAPMTSEIANLEDSTFKVGKLSVEQRKEKIHRYMKKRNERNFSKKIKYACRKTLADSRPRVRGRFAKNDDFGENNRHNNHHEDDDYDDVMVKEEDEVVDSSDIFAHISGVNSFKCNYQQIPSWI
ncbi:zinc finger protein CONSTANS-LIKE 5 isoform X2 [Spinacia oleracea]|uniref:Zinc finger protein CONSTANS-LIKE 5 isoform X2 n=1 Tax=Spinacia oleracea TaxID=3562 RepID=A0A9R0JW34_SPIOL|nr:zinc finger protein CONSTANS-LIKE 5-like isoform X2 [Spinacia oleracea]